MSIPHRWRGRTVPTAVCALLAITACKGHGDRRSDVQSVALDQFRAAEAFTDSDFVAARETWITLSDEPSTHMRLAREAYETGHRDQAARDLDKSAAFFRWGRHYAADRAARRDFAATARELEDAARTMREDPEREPNALDPVLSSGYRVLAEHHLGSALREWEVGEYVRSALLLETAATEVARGFALSGESGGHTIDASVAAARATSRKLRSGRPPTQVEVQQAIRDLQTGARALGERLRQPGF